MSTSILIADDLNLALGLRKSCLKSMAICAASAASTLEILNGKIGTIATFAVGAGGTLYAVGDKLTLVKSHNGEQAIFEVAAVDAPETGVITELTLISGGTGYDASATYATTTDSADGTEATVTASTITDTGESVGKIACAANASTDLDLEDLMCYDGFSVRITGSGAKGYIYYE